MAIIRNEKTCHCPEGNNSPVVGTKQCANTRNEKYCYYTERRNGSASVFTDAPKNFYNSVVMYEMLQIESHVCISL